MYLPIEPQPTNVQGWLAAASAVRDRGGEAHNVVIDIADPLHETEQDAAITREVDQFLRAHNCNSLSSVANTIFPQGTLDQHGPEAFYDVYRETVFPRMKQMTHDWGRYFDRLTRWKKLEGKEIKTINPLQDLIRFMRTQVESAHAYRNAYEMTVYDPARDAGKVRGRQCLSFLSFKLTEEKQLLLTVMYRNHAYIARGLGNLIGLGRLQAFVAQQTGVTMGSLTCISTHAEIDHGKNENLRRGQTEGWTSAEANALLDRCRVLNARSQAA
jgi:thymidylate synthase